jgi:DNA-binding NarL/FixJ family response regulator
MLASTVIAEDHDLTRQGIRSLLENRLDASVVETTGDGLEAFPLVEEHEPDLLILDLGLPHLNGLEVLRKIQKKDYDVRVVVLSMHGGETYVRKAFELGAAGYVLKGAPLEELLNAIRVAISGDRYISGGLSEDLLDSVQSPDTLSDRYETLTEREREVLQLTAEGYSGPEIGERLHISSRTVEKHRENLQAKLELRNVVEMAAYAYQRRLIPHFPDLAEESEPRVDGSANRQAGMSS